MEDVTGVYRVRDDNIRELHSPMGDESRVKAFRLDDCLDICFQEREESHIFSILSCIGSFAFLLVFQGLVAASFVSVFIYLMADLIVGDIPALWFTLAFHIFYCCFIVRLNWKHIQQPWKERHGVHIVIGLDTFLIENLQNDSAGNPISGPTSLIFPAKVVVVEINTPDETGTRKYCEISDHQFGHSFSDPEREWIVSIINMFLEEHSLNNPA